MHTRSTKLRCNHAYIDGANLDKGTSALGWRVDYQKFYRFLQERYGVRRAYIFMGYISKYDQIYSRMRDAGFLVRFKDTIITEGSQIKGNCDADLVLTAVRDAYESIFDAAVIVTSDGDFASLVAYFREKDRLEMVISPNQRCSKLITRQSVPLAYMNRVREQVSG